MNRLHRFDVLVAWFKEHASISGYRPRTMRVYLFEISFFRRWLESATQIEDIDEVVSGTIRDYAAALFNKKRSAASMHHKLSALKCFFRALYEAHKLYIDPTTDVALPRIGKPLPAGMLTEKETAQVIEHLDAIAAAKVRGVKDAQRVRDRAAFEILYSTGMRRSEILGLRLADINYDEGLITIRDGKGGKGRVVPIGEKSLQAVRHYVDAARPRLATLTSADALLLTHKGLSMGEQTLRTTIIRIMQGAGITHHVKVHAMRHTCATHMLNHGADIRYVQEMLGHASLSSTQVYTHVSIGKLKETHRKYHPRESAECEVRNAE